MIGFIIAGGQSSRMDGQRKCLLQLGGQTMLDRIRNRLSPQVDQIVLNANGGDINPDFLSLDIVPDQVPGHLGPLAGLHACLTYVTAMEPSDSWFITVPSDTPFIPDDLVARLAAETANDCDVVVATSGGQIHPLSAMWRSSLLGKLESAIVDDEMRKVRHWLRDLRVRDVAFENESLDPFFNINSPEDLIEGERLVKAHNL